MTLPIVGPHAISDVVELPHRLDVWEGHPVAEIADEWKVPGLEILGVVGSTNDVARALASAGAPSGTVVLADRQAAGRGRAGRAWSSPACLGLYISFIARPQAHSASSYPILVALSIAEALDPWTKDRLAIKWPNDLLLDGRKVGGILCEASWAGGALTHLVAGIGINVLHRQEDFPAELRASATSLHSVSSAVSRFDVATAVVERMRDLIRGGRRSAGDDGWRAEFARRDALAGRRIDIFEPESGALVTSGVAEGIGDDGSLRVRRGDGLLTVRSGTIRFTDDHSA